MIDMIDRYDHMISFTKKVLTSFTHTFASVPSLPYPAFRPSRPAVQDPRGGAHEKGGKKRDHYLATFFYTASDLRLLSQH